MRGFAYWTNDDELTELAYVLQTEFGTLVCAKPVTWTSGVATIGKNTFESDPSEAEIRWRVEAARICNLLPSESQTAEIIAVYSSIPDWQLDCVSQALIAREVSVFWQLYRQGLEYKVDPLFLALYQMVIHKFGSK